MYKTECLLSISKVKFLNKYYDLGIIKDRTKNEFIDQTKIFVGFPDVFLPESNLEEKEQNFLWSMEFSIVGDTENYYPFLSSILQIHNDYDGFRSQFKDYQNEWGDIEDYKDNPEDFRYLWSVNKEQTLRIFEDTKEWYFHNDIDIVTISYSEGISLFHHYFSAYKILVEQYLPPEQKQKITNTEWWPKFLSELPKLEKIYNELVEKGEIEVQELSPENTEKNVETKNFQ